MYRFTDDYPLPTKPLLISIFGTRLPFNEAGGAFDAPPACNMLLIWP
jgi:hypothetical protein